MTTYTTVFSGNLLQPSNVAYIAIALSSDITLSWPTDFQNQNNAVAATMKILPTAGGFTVTMPDARNASNGFVTSIYNTTSYSFNLLNNDGTTLQALQGPCFYTFLLESNATQNGTWQIFPNFFNGITPSIRIGDINISGNTLSSVNANEDINIDTNGIGRLNVKANLDMSPYSVGVASKIYFYENSGVHYASIGAQGSFTTNVNYILPDDGYNGQALVTNGSGGLSFSSSPLIRTSTTLSSAEILALNVTPVFVVGPGLATGVVMIAKWAIVFKHGGITYAGGSDLALQYQPGISISGTIPTSALVDSADSFSYQDAGVFDENTVGIVNQSIEITCPGPAFTTGNGTATVYVWYSVIDTA